VRRSPSIKEIVITGGDPFMNRANMACAIDGLMDGRPCPDPAPGHPLHRLLSRTCSWPDDGALLSYLKRKNLELQARGKRMEVATHFIHPDEISPPRACRLLPIW
jgi:lysine 2,3-aminomutase